jgi:hypothetical protein
MWSILPGHNLVRAALALQVKMRVGLHEHFLVRTLLLYLLAKLQPRLGEVANIHNDQVIFADGSRRAGGMKIDCGIHFIAFHAENNGTQVLHGCVAIYKQYPGGKFGTRHGGNLGVFLACFAKRTPLRAPANGPFAVTHLEFIDLFLTFWQSVIAVRERMKHPISSGAD